MGGGQAGGLESEDEKTTEQKEAKVAHKLSAQPSRVFHLAAKKAAGPEKLNERRVGRWDQGRFPIDIQCRFR